MSDAMGNTRYSLLKDLRAEIEVKDGTFSLCFWVYLTNSTTFPATIIQQLGKNANPIKPKLWNFKHGIKINSPSEEDISGNTIRIYAEAITS
ncbi:hypothetical protein PIB30_013072 [Stylosanthes scabra]|uniref:Uncharacterized protein n=1 Tax=Stylosanthes scabra TaxID=79078 RepID=A0ABU6U7Y4_9FABA|nr:hypothetical protein [Stylosanthes scabra]